MSDAYTLGPYSPGDEGDIVRLLDVGLNGWPNFDIPCSPLEHWRWKYMDNPQGFSFIAVASMEGELIGVSHVLPLYLKIGDERLFCTYGCDVTIHPDKRGIGVYKAIRKKSHDIRRRHDVWMNYSVTVNPIVKSYWENTGRQEFPHRVKNLVRIQDIDAHLDAIPMGNRLYWKTGFLGSSLLNQLRNTHILSSHTERDGITIRPISSFNKDVEEFWRETSKGFRFSVDRCLEYLNWRYFDPRAGGFTIYQAEDESDNPLGFIVLKINKRLEDYPVGYIIDLLSKDAKVADALIKKATTHFDENDVNCVLTIVVEGNPQERLYLENGFLDSKIDLNLGYDRYENTELTQTLLNTRPSQINFSYGDIDSLPLEPPR